jgi:glutathione peroxidase
MRTALLALLGLWPAQAQSPAAPAGLYGLTARSIEGQDVPLSRYKGQVLLIVNTASKCGYTPQYKALQAVHDRYAARGFSVLGFPSNDFLWQEPGKDAEIKKFCELRYGVTFPLFTKDHVKGKKTQPVFQWLKASPVGAQGGEIGWNFTKFVVGRDGRVVARFPSKVTPDDPQVIRALEDQLSAKP